VTNPRPSPGYGCRVATAATPFGSASIVDEIRISQRAGGRRFGAALQLLEGPGGERLIRVAYATDGVARRGPVTLRERDLARLRVELGAHPELARAIVGTTV